jgi:hypothetical protein
VQRLAALNPAVLVPGHGSAMMGEELQNGLQHLLSHWQEEAVPDHGRWVRGGASERE